MQLFHTARICIMKSLLTEVISWQRNNASCLSFMTGALLFPHSAETMPKNSSWQWSITTKTEPKSPNFPEKPKSSPTSFSHSWHEPDKPFSSEPRLESAAPKLHENEKQRTVNERQLQIPIPIPIPILIPLCISGQSIG